MSSALLRATCRRAARRWSTVGGCDGSFARRNGGVNGFHTGASSWVASGGWDERDADWAKSRRSNLDATSTRRAHSAALSFDETEPVNPFTIVNDELSAISARMRQAVTSEVPALATAAEYFFKVGAEGKRMRPTVLLLMASALTDPLIGRRRRTQPRQGGER